MGWAASLEEAAAVLAQTEEELASLVEGLAEIPNDAPARAQLAKIDSAVCKAIEVAQEAAATAATDLGAQLGRTRPIAKGFEAWNRVHTQFEDAYAAAKERSAAHESQLQALAELEKRLKQLRKQLSTQRAEVKRIGDPGAKHRGLRDEWLKVQKQRSDMLAVQCQAMTQLSSGLIRASLSRGTELAVMAERFRAAVGGSGLRSAKVDAVFDRLREAEVTLDAWVEMLDELEQYLVPGHDGGPRMSAPRSALAALTTADRDRLRSRFTVEDVLELSLVPPGDRPVFEYRVRAGEYIAFEVASAGQQATALLRVLLNQPGHPLVIDQPEDDSTVRSSLRSSKRSGNPRCTGNSSSQVTTPISL